MRKIKSWIKNEKFIFFIDTVLYSYSQILFAKNRFVGLFILSSTFVHPSIAVNALLSCIFANSFALGLGINRLEIRAGLYGFNAVLLGMSMTLYMGIRGMQAIVYILLFSSLLTVVTGTLSVFLKRFSLPYMSIPFVLVTWLAILAGDGAGNTKNYIIFTYPEIETFLTNIGYIIFSPNSLSGILVLGGLFLYSRLMGIVVIISYLACIAFVSIFPAYSLFMTAGGFNAILTSIAVAGIFFVLSAKSLFIGIIASVFTVITGSAFSSILLNYGLPVLTIPFNLVTLLTLYMMDRCVWHNDLRRVQIPESPEGNVMTSIRQKEGGRINLLTDRRLSLPFMGWWFVSQSVDGVHTHKGIFRYGLDFVVPGKNGKPYSNTGEGLNEHYCYDMPVIASADGIVAAVVSSVTDNPVASTNLQYNWGNYVIIQHCPDFFSVAAHLRQKGITVNIGQVVKKGQTVGYAGSSGLSPYPHLHIQFQPAVSMWSPTLPPHFSDFLVRHKDYDEYITVGIPSEQQTVMNLPADNSVREAIGFELREKSRYELNFNNKVFFEDWLFDMDSDGLLFIESSLHKDRLYFIKGDTSISFLRYSGTRKSGLFILSLGIDKIPFYVDDRMKFQRTTPYLDIITGIRAYLFDIIIPFYKGLRFFITHTFKAGVNEYLLTSRINGRTMDIAERTIVFERGVKEIIFKSRHINCIMKRVD
ncbi:MAG: urea transporter [Deltaproteobacteria bacterium]|nr:urea transporter [Deltaproteobacteria bacterium]